MDSLQPPTLQMENMGLDLYWDILRHFFGYIRRGPNHKLSISASQYRQNYDVMLPTPSGTLSATPPNSKVDSEVLQPPSPLIGKMGSK